MSILTKLNPVNWLAEKAALQVIRANSNPYFRALWQYVGTNMPTYMSNNPTAYIEHGYASNDDVFSIVNYIATKASTIPWRLYRVKSDGSLEPILKHEILNLIERPNKYQGQASFIHNEIGYKLLTGNTYQYAPRLENGINKGKTKELYVLPAHLTDIVFGSITDPYGGFTIKGYYNDKIAPENVLHRKEWNPLAQEELYGMSRLRAGAKVVGKSTEGREAGARALKNMGPPGMITGGGTSNDNELTDEQALKLQQKYLERHTGRNSNIPIITSAAIKWQQMGISPADLQIIQSLNWDFLKLCNLYMLPAEVLNSKEASTYNNVNEAKKAAYEDAILPELWALRDEWNRWLCPMWGDDLWLDIDTSGISVLQEDKKEQAEWLAKSFWIKGTRKQAIMGEEEDPAMDRYFDANGVPLMLDGEIDEPEIDPQKQQDY